MSRLLGYMCSDDTLTYAVMDEVADDLNGLTTGEHIARGFGWLKEGRSLLRKQPPQGSTGVDFTNLVSDIPAREIVGYECEPERPSVDTLDLQPFCFRTWVYAQDGELSSLAGHEQQDAMLEELPDHIRRNIDGESLEEICFHVFLAALQDRGGFGLSASNPTECVSALVDTVEEIESRLDGDKSSDDIFDTDMVTVSERLLIAVAGDESVYYRKFEGIEEEQEEPLFAGHHPQVEEHPHFRAVLVTNELDDGADGWEELPPRHVMWVGSDWDINIEPLESFGDEE